MFPGLFLDRDGVIIENRESYVRTWEEVAFYPQALSALARLAPSPFKIVLVTNQSAVGRGIISYDAALEINRRVIAVVEQAGGRIDGAFMCPHAPVDACECRKPRPGLLLQAAQALSIDLSSSMMVGDALSDLQAGRAAGVRWSLLVRTGRGAGQADLPDAQGLRPISLYDSLAEVVEQYASILLPGS
jgi:D-glycero-D-manno-heptose 1,7-bisphosphate phosphatase